MAFDIKVGFTVVSVKHGVIEGQLRATILLLGPSIRRVPLVTYKVFDWSPFIVILEPTGVSRLRCSECDLVSV